MNYRGSTAFDHRQPRRIGVLLTNLGTPAAPTPGAVKTYLREFLSDPRVVEWPRWLWWIILRAVILVVRPRRSARAYQSVWTAQGSPLMLNLQAQCAALRQRIQADYGDQVMVEYAMRYGQPCLSSAVERMHQQGLCQLIVLPLYPQYSATTTASTFDALAADLTRRRWLPDVQFISHYHDFAPYIQAMAAQITRYWQQHGQPDRLILSYHGIPQRYVAAGDPYFCECHKTSRLLAQQLGLDDQQYCTTFQSRLGREPWLQPYTDHTLTDLATQGVATVHLFCPGFSADCLETLEEIAQENKQLFLRQGGQQYHYIPALNAEPEHIEALLRLVEPFLQRGVQYLSADDPEHRLKSAQQAGAQQ